MRHLLSFFILFESQQSFCQVSIRNMSLTIDTNIIYHKVDNYLELSGNSQNLMLLSQKGNKVTSYGANKFKVYPTSLGADTLLVYSGKKLLLRKRFRVDTVHTFKVQLGNISKDTATTTEIVVNGGLRIVSVGSFYKNNIRIVSFITSFLGINGEALANDIPTEGNLLTAEQKKVIETLKRNDRISFTIIVIGPDGRRRELAPYIMVIK